MAVQIYMVGTYPYETAEEALECQQRIDTDNQWLWAFGGGETGAPNWLVGVTHRIAKMLGIPFTAKFTGLEYSHFGARFVLGMIYKFRVNRRLRQHGVPKLGYAETARREYAIVAASVTGRRFMVGLPTAWALMIMSGVSGSRNLRMFEDELAREINEILEIDPSIVIQWEMPIELALASLPTMPTFLRQRWLRLMMSSLDRTMSKVERKASWTIHLCNGDLKNQPVLWQSRQLPKLNVKFMNALTALRVWRQGHILLGIHEPHSRALSDQDLQVYRQLQRRPRMYSWGALMPQASPEQIARELRTMQDILQGVPAMDGTDELDLTVSPRCGLGRTPHEDVRQVLKVHTDVNDILDSTEER